MGGFKIQTLYPVKKKKSGIHWIGGWVDPNADHGILGKNENG